MACGDGKHDVSPSVWVKFIDARIEAVYGYYQKYSDTATAAMGMMLVVEESGEPHGLFYLAAYNCPDHVSR
jgi:hypothetical protein